MLTRLPSASGVLKYGIFLCSFIPRGEYEVSSRGWQTNNTVLYSPLPHVPSTCPEKFVLFRVCWGGGYRVYLKLDCRQIISLKNHTAISVSSSEINEWLIAVVNSWIKHNISVCLWVSLPSLQSTRLTYSQTVRATTLCHHQSLECRGWYHVLNFTPSHKKSNKKKRKYKQKT